MDKKLSGDKIPDMKFFIVSHLKNYSEKIIILVKIKFPILPFKKSLVWHYAELRCIYLLNQKPSVKVIIATPVLKVDKTNADENDKTYIEILKMPLISNQILMQHFSGPRR